MIPANINLVECNLTCFSRECWDFFENLGEDRFVVKFKSDHVNKCEYGLLEKNLNASKHTVITLNGNFLYNYGEGCKILGYCPVKINDQK